LCLGPAVLGTASLQQTSVALSALACFPIDLPAGGHTLTLRFRQWREPDAGEARRLAMMLRRLDLIAL
jgi:hypothetical protein